MGIGAEVRSLDDEDGVGKLTFVRRAPGMTSKDYLERIVTTLKDTNGAAIEPLEVLALDGFAVTDQALFARSFSESFAIAWIELNSQDDLDKPKYYYGLVGHYNELLREAANIIALKHGFEPVSQETFQPRKPN